MLKQTKIVFHVKILFNEELLASVFWTLIYKNPSAEIFWRHFLIFSLANTPKNGHHFCLPVFFTFCNCLPTFRNRPPLACANIVRGKMFNLHCLVCVCPPGLKGPCHEIFNTFLSKNSTWAPYEQAKTV